MLGISNYQPCFFNSLQEVINKIGSKLNEFKGKRITDIWVVWDTKSNKWFADCPVILIIDNIQLELCAWKLSEFAITINTIDITKPVEYYEIDDFALEWRNSAMHETIVPKDKTIKEIEIVEMNFKSEIKYSKDNPENIGKLEVCWLLNGIGFKLEEGYFSVLNGLDENFISLIPAENNDMKRTKI